MPFQSVPNTAECVIRGVVGGKNIAHVLHFDKLGGYVQSDLDGLAEAIDIAVGDDYIPQLPTDVDYVATHVRGLQNIVDLEAINATHAGPGTNTGTAAPANASLCITLRSGQTGRSARGRVFTWPPPRAAMTSAQTINTSYATALVAVVASFRSAGTAAGWRMVITSRRNNGVERLVGVNFPVLGIDVRNLDIDSQRGRLLPNH